MAKHSTAATISSLKSDGGMKGWQDALQRMRAGSKWVVFILSELAFGHEGEPGHRIGPDATLIHEMELCRFPLRAIHSSARVVSAMALMANTQREIPANDIGVVQD